MAFGGEYRSPRHGSNSCISPIDGIGIKISERLAPPPMVTLPPTYSPGNPSQVLFMEYDFSMEEHVLKWSEMHRQNEEALQREAIERAKLQAATEAAAEPAVGTAAVETETPQSGSEQASPPPPNPSPFINLGSSILTPMPINQGHKRKESGSKNAQTGLFDLTDFENEQDPFENMALKVLDDREELNKMVFEVQPLPSVAKESAGPAESGRGPPVNPPKAAVHTSPPRSPVNLKDVDYPEVESLDSEQFPLPQQPYAVSQVPLPTNTQAGYYQPPHTTTGLPPSQPVATTAPAYPSQHIARENIFNYSQGVTHPAIPKSHYLTHQVATPSVATTYANAGMPVSSVADGANAQTESVAMSLATARVSYTNRIGDKGYVPYQNYYSRHSVVPNGHVPSGQATGQTGGQPASQGYEIPPLNPLRSARSTPDISGSDERRLSPLMPSSHTPPPIATCSRPRSPNDFNRSTNQMSSPHQVDAEMESTSWNPYSVRPLTPRAFASSTAGSIASHPKTKSPNPFDSLPHETQRYVENITDMGFPRALVARAVLKLGTNDKKVVDHLCMVTRLVDKGHTEADSETALHLFENNIEQAQQYLKLLSQFKEIGFVEKNVREALVSTNLDENKTLDRLTAS